MNLRIFDTDLADTLDAERALDVLDSYASDPVGGGQPLAHDVRARLPSMLRELPTSLVLVAAVDDRYVGIAVCFFSISTFRAKPLLNVHDLAVVPEYRGKGIVRALLQAAEARARQKGCCKLTLEVQDDNARARALYRSFGFEDFVVGSSAPTRFLAKPLNG